MTYKYEVLPWRPHIRKVECLKETPKTVTVWVYYEKFTGPVPERRKKEGNFFDTWGEAKAELVKRAEANCQSIRLQLQRADGHLGNIKGLKEEKDA